MNVKIYEMRKYNGKSQTKAFVDLLFNDELIVKGFTLVQSKDGLFLGNPSQKGKGNDYFDTVKFVTPDQKQKVEKIVIDRYNE